MISVAKMISDSQGFKRLPFMRLPTKLPRVRNRKPLMEEIKMTSVAKSLVHNKP